jgi:hypothetical protein
MKVGPRVPATLRRLIVNLRFIRRSLGQIRRFLGLTGDGIGQIGGALGRLEVPWADWRRLRLNPSFLEYNYV